MMIHLRIQFKRRENAPEQHFPNGAALEKDPTINFLTLLSPLCTPNSLSVLENPLETGINKVLWEAASLPMLGISP